MYCAGEPPLITARQIPSSLQPYHGMCDINIYHDLIDFLENQLFMDKRIGQKCLFLTWQMKVLNHIDAKNSKNTILP